MQQVLANVFVAFSEMKEFNKRKRTEFIAATVPQKSRKQTNTAMFRRVSFANNSPSFDYSSTVILLNIIYFDLLL